jgi:hypothetical protein
MFNPYHGFGPDKNSKLHANLNIGTEVRSSVVVLSSHSARMALCRAGFNLKEICWGPWRCACSPFSSGAKILYKVCSSGGESHVTSSSSSSSPSLALCALKSLDATCARGSCQRAFNIAISKIQVLSSARRGADVIVLNQIRLLWHPVGSAGVDR